MRRLDCAGKTPPWHRDERPGRYARNFAGHKGFFGPLNRSGQTGEIRGRSLLISAPRVKACGSVPNIPTPAPVNAPSGSTNAPVAK